MQHPAGADRLRIFGDERSLLRERHDCREQNRERDQ